MHQASIIFSGNNNWNFPLSNNGQFMWLLVIVGTLCRVWSHQQHDGGHLWPQSSLSAPGSQSVTNIFLSTNTFSCVVVSFVKISPAANKNTMVDIKTSFHAAICINLYKSPRRLMWPCLVKRQAKAKSIPYISPRLSPRTFCFHIFSTDK